MSWLRNVIAGARSHTREQQLHDAIVQLAHLEAETVSRIIRSDDPQYERLFPLSPGIDLNERKLELITVGLFTVVRACHTSWDNSPEGHRAAQSALDMIHAKCFEVVSTDASFSRSALEARTAVRYREYNALLNSQGTKDSPNPLDRFAYAVCEHLGYRDAARLLVVSKCFVGKLVTAKELFDDLKRYISVG